MCREVAVALGVAEHLAASGAQGGACSCFQPARSCVEDGGFLSEPLERFGVCFLFLFTRAISYIWNILLLLPFTWPTPIHLLCLSLNVTSLETILVSQLFLLSASFVFPTVHLLQVIILLFMCVYVCVLTS